MRKRICNLIFLFLCIIYAKAESPGLVLLDLAAGGTVPGATTAASTVVLLSYIQSSAGDRYAVVDLSTRNRILEGNPETLSRTTHCLAYSIKIGRVLAADYVVSGSVFGIGRYYHLSIRLIDVKSESVRRIYQGVAADVKELAGRLKQAANRLLVDEYAAGPEEELDKGAYIPLIDALAAPIRFFEGIKAPGSEEFKHIKYQTLFQSLSTRGIFWGLELRYPRLEKTIDFYIIAVWYTPDGTILHRSISKYTFHKGKNRTFLGGAFIRKKIGDWKNGIYTVDIYIGTRKIVSGLFEVK